MSRVGSRACSVVGVTIGRDARVAAKRGEDRVDGCLGNSGLVAESVSLERMSVNVAAPARRKLTLDQPRTRGPDSEVSMKPPDCSFPPWMTMKIEARSRNARHREDRPAPPVHESSPGREHRLPTPSRNSDLSLRGPGGIFFGRLRPRWA